MTAEFFAPESGIEFAKLRGEFRESVVLGSALTASWGREDV